MAEVVVLVTVANESEGLFLGKVLVKTKVAACVNIVPRVVSVFEWEGQVSEESECLMIVKSTSDAFGLLESTIKSHHSYSVPEIIALPIVAGSEEYLAWVRETTKLGRN